MVRHQEAGAEGADHLNPVAQLQVAHVVAGHASHRVALAAPGTPVYTPENCYLTYRLKDAKTGADISRGVYHFDKSMPFRRFSYSVMPDFKQPPFYEDYFKKWGLEGPKK